VAKTKIHKREIQKEIRVGIDPDEREPYVKDMISAQKELDKLALDQADSNATFRKLRKEQEAKRDEAMATLERGRPEMKTVIEIKNFSTGKVKYQDPETNRVLEEREMTDEDRQMGMGERADDEPEAEDAEAR